MNEDQIMFANEVEVPKFECSYCKSMVEGPLNMNGKRIICSECLVRALDKVLGKPKLG